MDVVAITLYYFWWVLCFLLTLTVLARAAIDTFVVLIGLFDFLWLKEQLIKQYSDEKDALGIGLLVCAMSWWLAFNLKQPYPDILYLAGLYLYSILFYWARAYLFRWAQNYFGEYAYRG